MDETKVSILIIYFFQLQKAAFVFILYYAVNEMAA